MKIAILGFLGLAAVLAAEVDLSTSYTAERALRIETVTTFSMEQTAMEFLRDGEPGGGGRGGGGGGGNKTSRSSVVVDRYLDCADGAPTRVQRSFEAVEGESERSGREGPVTTSVDSPFAGITLELTADEDGEVAVEVVDGDEPDEDALEGHAPSLALDALLPEDSVEEGESWDLESGAILRALGLDIAAGMYPRPEREAPAGGGRGGGGGGRRGGFGGGGGDSMQQLVGAEWTGSAELEEGVEDQGGVACYAIALELSAETESDNGEGVTSSFSIELEGTLYVAVDDRRPVLLEVEGPVESDMDMERERQGSLIEIHRESEGTFALRVSISDAPFEDAD